MKDIHYSLKPNRNSKQQALEIIKLLQESIPIEKAQMRLLLTIPPKKAKTVLETLQKFIVSIEKEEWEEDLMVTCLVDPGHYRNLEESLMRETTGKGHLEVLSLKTQILGDSELN
eukprot:Sdes_comp20876_c0_seq11m17857